MSTTGRAWGATGAPGSGPGCASCSPGWAAAGGTARCGPSSGGARVSEKVVLRLMREEGLRARGRRRRRAWSSYRGEASPAPPNLPLLPGGTHLFRAGRPNELWATGITEFRPPSGERRYLSPVIDCLDGGPVSWSVGPRPTAAVADSSLAAACATLAPGEAPVVHSDRGFHYSWPGWVAPSAGTA